MQIAMTAKEQLLLESFLRRTNDYFEFGAGGSTWLATQLVSGSVVSVDSSLEWMKNVRIACAQHAVQPDLRHIDIGPLKEWGVPSSYERRSEWPQYSGAATPNADFYLVDGRFRVASFTQILLISRPSALIAIHDFGVRPEYDCLKGIAREVAQCEKLSVFIKDGCADLEEAERLRIKHLYDAI